MVSLYYPAIAGTGIPAPYAPLGEARAPLTYRGELSRHTNAEQVAAVRTHAREGALPRTGHGRYPLIVLSPGFTPPCSSADSASRTAPGVKTAHTPSGTPPTCAPQHLGTGLLSRRS
ncbi:hypothetical protein ACFYN3_38720 [Streptomyces lavendulae]|uniref:hypothetical protein n=1 Tax=Streptomyces lavendulae TaxID=1914 RepID=UPI00368ED3EC